MAQLSIESVSKRFSATPVLENVSAVVGDSELVALLGPSGCGKTTLLRMVAGLLGTTEGRIHIGPQDVTRVPPYKRNTGMVFQNYALFPHMTVHENVAFGLEMRRVSGAELRAKVEDALRLVRLEGLAGRYPRELSGGQQQRVAVARALVIRPDVFLLDEPLSNLDAKLRQQVGLELRALQQSLGLTTVFVTHDQSEALALADRLVLMDEGRIVQSGTAAQLYTRPANAFVASFLGHANLLAGRVDTGSRFLTDQGVAITCDTRGFSVGERAVLCVRPENIEIGAVAEDLPNRLQARVEVETYLGSTTELTLRLASGDGTVLAQRQNRAGASEAPPAAETCVIGWSPSSCLLLHES